MCEGKIKQGTKKKKRKENSLSAKVNIVIKSFFVMYHAVYKQDQIFLIFLFLKNICTTHHGDCGCWQNEYF
jgi:hypothetical protein